MLSKLADLVQNNRCQLSSNDLNRIKNPRHNCSNQNREFMEQLLHITDMENQELQADTIRADLIQVVALIHDLTRDWVG